MLIEPLYIRTLLDASQVVKRFLYIIFRIEVLSKSLETYFPWLVSIRRPQVQVLAINKSIVSQLW